MCVKMLAILLLAPHMIRFFSIYKVSLMKWSPLMYNITALAVAILMVLQGDVSLQYQVRYCHRRKRGLNEKGIIDIL